MNLAVHGLEGEIKRANSYYDEDVRGTIGQFDFVMANPPFNVNNIDKERLKGDKRFPFGLPNVDNGNYIWIQLFYSALHNKGRAGFVMANSATDARSSEMEILKKLIQAGDLDVIVSVGSNFFYTVTLPCTLWFLRKGKNKTLQKGTVLFLDLREIFTQVDRAHREFSPEQIEFIANIVRLYRGEPVETVHDPSGKILKQRFPKMKYHDIPGLCKTATIKEIEEQDWSLNPGRYVGITEKKDDGVDFTKRLRELNTELEQLNTEAEELQKTIAKNVKKLM
jgi:type I restriction enzyme M protein